VGLDENQNSDTYMIDEAMHNRCHFNIIDHHHHRRPDDLTLLHMASNAKKPHNIGKDPKLFKKLCCLEFGNFPL
jgi:hypothetical protein